MSVGYNQQGMGMPQSLTSSITGNPAPVYSASYNEWGQLSSLQQGSTTPNNLLTTAYQYSVRGWLTNTLVTAPNGLGGTNNMLNLSVSYFLNGNISSISNQNITNPSSTNPTYTNTYTYDWLNRLASASSSSSQIGSLFASEQYQFDNLSRMTTRTIGGTAYNYTYGNTAHVDAPTAYSYGSNTYSYDAAGNQTSGTVKGVSQSTVMRPRSWTQRIINIV